MFEGIPIRGLGALFSLKVPGESGLSLKSGEVVKAKVVELLPGGNAKLSVKNTLVEVKTEAVLTKGTTVTLRVERSGDEVRLRMIETETPKEAALKNTLKSAFEALKGARLNQGELKALSDFTRNLPPVLSDKLPAVAILKDLLRSIKDLTGKGLKDAVKESGLFFESRLKAIAFSDGPELESMLEKLLKSDLKGALLKTQAALKEPDFLKEILRSGVNTEELQKAVEKMLKNIEHLQVQSRLLEAVEVFLPCLWKGLRDGTLIFKEEIKGGSGLKRSTCTINLDLERSGRVSALLSYEGPSRVGSGGLHLSFLAEDKGFVELIKGGEEILRKSFDAQGLVLASIRASHKEKIDFSARAQEGRRESALDIKA